MGKIEIHQKDANADRLKEAAEKLGLCVEVMQRPVDYLVGYQGLSVAVEIKTEKGKLRPSQVEFLDRFTGAATVWRSLEDVQATHRQLMAQAKRLRAEATWEP